ncbi:MAG TPA: hypothetical protein VFY17_02285, partial [Pilimelia sp.]|nr:hypothetical protein [Pilimelia sp.]
MSVLVLNRNPLGPFPHHEWLRDYPGPVILVADRSRIVKMGEPVPTGPVGHCELVLVDSFDANEDAVRRLLRELADRHGARHVVALSEPDLDLAAELREERDLPGPRAADIAAFRDKLLMKQRAAAAGVTTASYAPARDAAAVRDFARTHGLPVVVKNRSGYNAIGLRIARDAAQLDAALAAAFPDGRTRDDLLVERYVPGRMCHVDGVVIDGRPALAWPSQYQYELATFGSDPGARIDLTLDPGDPLTPRLLDLVDRVLPALAGDGGRMRDHAFHAEVFHTPDDELVLCEVAARPAG